MFETLMRLYDGGNGKLTVQMLENAVIKEYINDEQKQVILASAK